MLKTYSSNDDLGKFILSFERAEINREDWRHADHIAVAVYYLINFDRDVATVKMRSGIFNLLRSFEIDLEKEMHYHETLTVFWMKTLEKWLPDSNSAEIYDVINIAMNTFDKDYPYKFYSHEHLFSDTARKIFVEPDLMIANSYEKN